PTGPEHWVWLHGDKEAQEARDRFMALPSKPVTKEPPVRAIGHFVRNHETDKLHLHFSKTSWNALPEQHKKMVRSNFLWAPSQGAWVSRAKLNHAYSAEQAAKAIGLEDRGHEGDKLSFEEQKQAEAARAGERAAGLTEAAQKREREVSATHKRWEWVHGDIAFATQPGHIPARERYMKQTERAWEKEGEAKELRQRAATAEETASRAQERNP